MEGEGEGEREREREDGGMRKENTDRLNERGAE